MHLEKVTSRSSEAGLAGWIASNDVTLFTMVLVMVIAIFLHTRLNKSTRERLQMSAENAAISATLQSTASELDDARELLDRTTTTLHLTQEERDQLQTQLVEKLSALAELNAKLDALLAEKGQLETQRQSLLAAKESLTREQAVLLGDRDALSTANLTLRERLDALSAELAQKIAALEEVEAQRDRITKQADELDSIVAALKQRLKEMNVELVESRDQADAARVAADAQAETYLAQIQRAAALLQSLEAEQRQLRNELTETERQHQAELLAEAENNRRLVGLKGPLQRVAILIDASGSMRQLGAGGGDRWAEAQDIAAIWLRHLNVEQCALIVYSSQVRTFPEDRSFADLRGVDGAETREALLRQVKAITPGGATNTYDALRTAYEYEIDTVLLLSDGAPSMGSSGAYDDALAQRIYRLCRAHPRIPVNTIGLGNYFDQETSTFLRTVASITGGAFRGE